jgi:hypothetical protein
MHAPATQAILPISDLRADLVPHNRWATRRWFYANPIWYYHRKSAAHEIRLSGRFYQLVDPELREVCRLLNDAGLHTTPSCQGHDYPRDRFEQIWRELQREAPAIRGEGLIVRDCENETPYLFRSPDWQVPWPSFDAFFSEAAARQCEGYLGIIVPPSHAALALEFHRDPYRTRWSALEPDDDAGADLGGALFGIHVKAPDEAERSREWLRFTRYVEDIVTPPAGQMGEALPVARPDCGRRSRLTHTTG